MIVYKTTCTVNGKAYVGKTTRVHAYESGRYIGSGKLLKHAIKKYGKENFVTEILCRCSTESELREAEKYWIETLGTLDPKVGYNLVDFSAGGKQSFPTSKETRERIALAKKKWWSEQSDRSLTKEHREKIGRSNVERFRDPAERAKCASFTGKRHTKETRKKMSESAMGHSAWNKGLKTGPRSAADREAMREGWRRRRERLKNE